MRAPGNGDPRQIVVGLLDDVRKRELVAMPRDRPDEARLARIVAERAAQCADRLRERALRHDDIAPDAFEDLTPMHGIAAALDEIDEQVEIAGDQRQLLAVPDQQARPRRQGEITEPVAWHGRMAACAARPASPS